MRIQKIEISNFKGFYDICVIDLHKRCKNLLVYGENGSGKSSLFQGLDLFLESDVKKHDFKAYQNIFAVGDREDYDEEIDHDNPKKQPANTGFIRLTLREDINSGEQTYEWAPNIWETGKPIILEANKAKGFLDYKSLLETYFLHRHEETVNLFDLLIKNLLADIINDITNNTFLSDWISLLQLVEGSMTKPNRDKLEIQIQQFNLGLRAKLDELKINASEILRAFEYNIEISLHFSEVNYKHEKKKQDRKIEGQSIILRVELSDRPFGRHHIFLNEAKLSAIALSIYLASLLLIPPPQLKLLVLDDVLIGLDMSNRLPVLDVLEQFFPEHQKIITTYDRQWYEMVSLRTDSADWKYVEFYRGHFDGFDIPILKGDQSNLDKAREHLKAKDYKACAVYIRSEFELTIKKLADKKRLKVKYSKSPERVSSEDFWTAIKDARIKDLCTGQRIPILSSKIVKKIEISRKFILNPLNHSHFMNVYEKELDDAIIAVSELRAEIQAIK